MGRPSRFSPEVRERAVRMVEEHQEAHASEWAVLQSVAPKLGCTAETLVESPSLSALHENDNGCGHCVKPRSVRFSKSLMGAFSASTGTAASMPYAAAHRSKAAGLIWPSVEWRRRWL